MTPDPIAEGLRLAEKATPRPWNEDVGMAHFTMVDAPSGTVAHGTHANDSAYIVHAANHFPDLAREVVALRDLLREVEPCVSGWQFTDDEAQAQFDAVKDRVRAALAAAKEKP